jgi:nucleotide-binding universal stress UspA family protein
MTFRTLLAALDGSADDLRVLDLALAVGQPDEARITALYADADPSEVPAAYLGDGTGIYLPRELWQSLELRITQQRQAALAHFQDWQQRTGLRDAVELTAGPGARLRVKMGPMPLLMREHGTVADLIVTAMPIDDGANRTMTLEAALFDTGRPVLALPAHAPTEIDRTAPVVIAWNGRPEAVRALKAALPLLARSRGEIILLNVGKPDDPEQLGPVVDYLGLHGISAHGLHLLDRPGGTGAVLLGEVAKRGAGLFVMGAYTHSRLRESILGGVSRHVIQHAAVPVFFAH